MGSKCDCVIGHLHSYGSDNELYLSDFVTRTKALAISINNNDYFHELKKRVTARDILDRRRGFTTIYNYCPWCGNRIDIKKCRDQLMQGEFIKD